MSHSVARLVAGAALAMSVVACASAPGVAQEPVMSGAPAAHNTLTAAEQSAGWRLLFDGRTTNGWRGYKATVVPSGWSVVDGTLTKSDATEDIVTSGQFGNFELMLDWKIARGGNAGIFYRGTEEFERIYWSAPEYQLLDDFAARDGQSRLTSAGAAYGLYPAPVGHLRQANEWNTARIVVNGNHVEHWLNGAKLLEYELHGPDWTAKVKASKFNEWPGYGKAPKGHIGIQGDHDGALALRNIKIRELK